MPCDTMTKVPCDQNKKVSKRRRRCGECKRFYGKSSKQKAATRKLNPYTQFVSDKMKTEYVKGLSRTDAIRHIAAMWQKTKAKTNTKD